MDGLNPRQTQKMQFVKTVKEIIRDKDKMRKITERAFQEIDSDHHGGITITELVF